MSVLDLSNHDFATFDAACLKASGVERVILGCWDYKIAERMLLDLRANGIVCQDLYAFLYYRLPFENNDVLNATALAREHGGITRIWLDCESTFDGPAGAWDSEAAGTTVADRYRITRAYYLSLQGLGYSPGIYTGAYWWGPKMGNTPDFANMGAPLWLANYGVNDPNNPRDPITTVAFGGWTDVAIHQYSSTIPVCGRGRDHNYWFMEEEGMTPEERAKLDAVYAALTGGIDKSIVDWNANGNSLLIGYTNHVNEPHTGGGGGGPSVPDHIHEPGVVSR